MAGLDLTGNQISTTYKSLLKTTNNTVLPASGKTRITDGEGNDASISLGRNTSGLKVFGGIDATSDISSDGNILSCGNITSCVKANVCGNLEVQTNKLCVTSSCTKTTNNTCIGGTLNVCGNATLNCILTVKNEIRGCKDIVAYYSSDLRLKDDLEVIEDSEKIVNGLTGYKFSWNDKSEKDGEDLGIIAQDAEKVIPTIVKERDDGYLAVDYIKLIPVMVEEIKRLNSEVNELKNKIK